MSYKDGIPLLSTFEDDPEDDGYGINSEVERRKFKCAKGHMCFGVVLVFAMVLVVALAISITLGFVLKSKSNDHPPNNGHDTGQMSSWSFDMSSDAVRVVTTGAGVIVSMSYYSSPEPPPTTPSSTPGGSVMSSGVAVLSSSPGGAVSNGLSPSVSLTLPLPSSSGVVQPSLVASIIPSASVSMSSSSSSVSSQPDLISSFSTVLPQIPSATPLQPTTSSYLSVSTSTSAMPTATPMVTPTAPPTTPPTAPPTSPPTTPPMCRDDTVMCPSPHDDRVYQFTQLPGNSLRVVLISDPSTDLSGAAMNVNAGSFNDPENFTGLAHFCEHMLFLGTGKYPDKNEYSNYLSTHGGYDNAYTSTQETNYFFNIQADFLEHALDMFAHFFIDPLFDARYVQSELNAVNQEHQKNLLNDGWKLWQLLKYVSSRDHPFHLFSTGDFETLNKTGVRDQLLQYYQARYSASTMNLVVYGKENISTLLDWVTHSFSDVPNTGAQPVSYTDIQPFTHLTPRIVVYQPQASTDTLTMYWQTPSLQPYPRKAIDTFIVRYLGHEGDGSIFKYLQRRNLASAVEAGVEVAADSFYLFKLQITLTDEGLTNVSEVVRTVFEFISHFKNITEDVNLKWDDFLSVSQVAFDYKERQSPSDYAKDIASTMRVNPNPADFLPNPRRFQLDVNLLHNILRRLTVGNCVMFIGTQKVNESLVATSPDNFQSVRQDINPTDSSTVPLPLLNLAEPVYSTPFSIYDMPSILITYWTGNDTNRELFLADPNMFIPDESNLVPVPPSNHSAPALILNDISNQLWTYPDTITFNEPKVNLRCELRTGKAMKTAQWAARAKLYLNMVNKQLSGTAFSAQEVGYMLTLKSNPRGVELQLGGGLSDQDIILRLLNITIRTLLNDGDVLNDPVTFNLAKADISNTLDNFNYTNLPFRYTYGYLQRVLLERPTWTNEAILQQLQGLDLPTILQFATSNLLNDLNFVCLVHGSMTMVNAESYGNLLTSLLHPHVSTTRSSVSGYPTTRVLLQSGREYGLSLPALNPMDANSVVNIVFQASDICKSGSGGVCDSSSLLHGVYLSLLQLIIKDECFTQLRTIELLGYVAFCHSTVNENIGSFNVLVQSEEFDPDHVLNSMNSFLVNYFNNTVMADDFEASFPDSVAVLRNGLSQKDLSLSDKTDRVWPEVMSGNNVFNLRHQQLDVLDQLSVDGFREFYHDLILDDSLWKKLTMVVYGYGKELKLDVECDVLYDKIDQSGTDLKSSCS